jgi:endonuclease YncB( thermonuclease family)
MNRLLFFTGLAGLLVLINGCSSMPDESNSSQSSCPIVQEGDTLYGKVVGVADGGTLKIMTSSNVEFRVRLAEIEPPEKYQAFWEKSKAALSSKVAARDVTFKVVRQDQYGDISAFVYIGGRTVNLEMVAEGCAWRAHSSRIKELAQAQKEAQSKRLGLWAGESPMPPWEYRRQRMNPPEANGRNEGGTIQPLFKFEW